MGELLEPDRVDGVEAAVDPVQPRLGQRGGDPGQPDGVRGEADLRPRAQRRRGGHDAHQAGTQQRLPAGEPDLADAELLHADPHEARDLVVGEHLDLGQPVQALGGHAVAAAQVAAVGQRDAQIGRDAAVPVDQSAGAGDRIRTAQHRVGQRARRGHLPNVVRERRKAIGRRDLRG